MSYIPPRPYVPAEPVTAEQLDRIRRIQLELFSSMHPFPRSWIEWWDRRRRR